MVGLCQLGSHTMGRIPILGHFVIPPRFPQIWMNYESVLLTEKHPGINPIVINCTGRLVRESVLCPNREITATWTNMLPGPKSYLWNWYGYNVLGPVLTSFVAIYISDALLESRSVLTYTYLDRCQDLSNLLITVSMPVSSHAYLFNPLSKALSPHYTNPFPHVMCRQVTNKANQWRQQMPLPHELHQNEVKGRPSSQWCFSSRPARGHSLTHW